MKKIFTLLLFGIVLFACEGPQGIPGDDGFDGLDGIDGFDGEESFVFEYELSFTAPDYSAFLELPSDFTMLDSDVMLAYLLWEVLDDGTEVWRAIPQSLFFTDGILHYNYDFTQFDATIFLDGTVSLDGLGANYTDNWIARLVVVPGQFTNGRSTVNLSDYNEVKEYFELPSSTSVYDEYVSRPE